MSMRFRRSGIVQLELCDRSCDDGCVETRMRFDRDQTACSTM